MTKIKHIPDEDLVAVWVTRKTRQAIKQVALTNNRTMIEELSVMYSK